MSVTRIRNPFQGERVIGLSPSPAARVTDWNRRLNLFTGRALSDSALTAEQNGRAGRLALRGQMVSPGVVLGLEVGLETQGGTYYLHVGTGFGVDAAGEDVVVAVPVRVPLGSLPVYAPSALLDGAPPLGSGELAARRLGPTLDELVAKKTAVPKAGIVLLQPVLVDQLANFDPSDSCEEDPSSQAFADEQLLDGARLVYYAWPDEWLLLPEPGERWRNRLAYAIFDRESLNGPDQIMPWEGMGLPIGLIGFDDNFSPLFIDRYAVVREGGKPKRRTPLVIGSGSEFLWQARMQQFAGHINDEASLAAADLAAEFRYLPPVGLLPKSAVTFETGNATAEDRVFRTQLFPGTYTINAVPAPVEQLDVVMRKCASLGEFDTFAPDQVTVIVPVPQIWYEPDLLQVLKIDPIFQQTVDQFVHQRALWLKRRQDVRAVYSAMVSVVSGVLPKFEDPDPDAVEPNEEVAAGEIDDRLDAFKNPEQAYGTTGTNPVTVNAAQELRATLSGMPGVKDELPHLDEPEMGLQGFAELLQSKADQANDKIDLGFLRVQTDIYRMRQKMLGTEGAARLAVSPALADIAQGTSALATKEDLESYLQKIKPAPGPVLPGDTHDSEGPKTGGTSSASSMFVAPRAFLAGSIDIGTEGFRIPDKTKAAETTKATLATGAPELFAAASGARVDDVTQQPPLVGGGYGLRTTSVVERLKEPPSAEVRQFTAASKFSAISSFKGAGISVGDISIPGFKGADGKDVKRPFSEIDDSVLGDILAGTHDPLPDNPTEADIFTAGVRAMENTVDILRLLEARVQLYRQAVDLCRKAISTINDNATASYARLQAIGNELGTSRHDVSMARALLAEEQARIDNVNRRRDQIVTDQVQFVAYCRPRTAEAYTDMPIRVIDPGVAVPSIPACLARNLAAPDELRAYVNLLREAPIAWFAHLPQLIDKLDRLDVLHSVVLNSKLRAGFKLQAPELDVKTAPGPLGPQILKVFSAHLQVVAQSRIQTSQVDLTAFAGATWAESKSLALPLLSIGDLIDLGHHHPEVPRVSAAEVENILKVAACLYSDFCVTLPAIRLNWAERLIQIDGTLNLVNLSSLPRWGEIPILERKEMQALVDWLFSRINTAQTDAVGHMNDLVRVCILLASHAPVADIIAGDVIRDTTLAEGSRIDLSADISRVRLGMHVLMYQGNQAVARGVVENLASGTATARVLTTSSPGITLARSAKVHFAAPDAFDRNPLTASLQL